MATVRPYPAYPGLLDSEDPRWAQTGAILNEYNPFPAFWRLMNSDMAQGGEITDQNIADGLTVGGTVMGASSVVTKPANALNMGIRAYHGSPHSFDKFEWSPRTYGTGEGAQAYGHGLYFAENEGVAKGYRDALSRQTSYDGVPSGNFHPSDGNTSAAINSVATRVADGETPAAAIAAEAAKWRAAAAPYAKAAAEKPDLAPIALQRAKSFEDVALATEALDPSKFAKNPGHVYEVSINADPNADFIIFDAPWENQPQKVKDAFGYLAKNKPDGSDLARRIEAPVFAQEASDKGVKGVQYLDAGSRGAGDGTRNYVVFDDSLIDIIKKYGIAGLLGGGGMYGMSDNQAQAGKY